MNDNEAITGVEVEEGQTVHINLEGIKLEGVSKEDAQRIAEAAAQQAFAVVEANYKDTITQLEADKAQLLQRAEDAEQQRDALLAEKAERERHAAYEALFNEFAIPHEARQELYGESFSNLTVEQARPVLKHLGMRVKPKQDSGTDPDVPLQTQNTEQLDDPVALGQAIAEQLMPSKAK